jgi:SAM-dependent methyltransferase
LSTKPPSNYIASTTAFYDAHASEFCEKTVGVDMSELYGPFLGGIPHGGRILDAGCGSGRDSLAFIRKGYHVVSMDASAEMVAVASRLTGQPALLMCFDEIGFDIEFDGIWACASLLHVARPDLPSMVARLRTALKPGGVFYLSFKYGDGERIERGRYFTDMNEALFYQLLATQTELERLRMWITDDVRNDREGRQRWLNALVRRRAASEETGVNVR